MNRFYHLATIVLLALTPVQGAFAQNTLVYSTTRIAIVSNARQVQTLDDAQAPKEKKQLEEDKADIAPARHEMDAEVREAQIPTDRGMYINYTLDDNHVVMTYFADDDIHPLEPEQIYNTVDVLFVRNDGTIVQIVPEVTLAGLEEEIVYDKPIRAFIFLQEGLAGAWGIQPGDHIEHGMFSPSPKIKKVEESQ